MVIDVHVHPEGYEPVYDEELTPKRKLAMGRYITRSAPMRLVLAQMDDGKIDKSVLLPLDLTTQCGLRVLENEEIKKLVDMYPDRFIGFASVDPYRPNALEVLEYAFSELRLSGLKLHPSRQKFYPDDPMMKPIYDMCVKYNKPIMFHAGTSWEPDTPAKYSKPLNYEEVAIEYPELRMCLAHFGWPWVPETCMMILKYPNVYADTSMLYMDRPGDFFNQIFKVDLSPLWIENCITKKVLFGSNCPRFGQGDMREGVEKLGLRDKATRAILGENALEYLGMEG